LGPRRYRSLAGPSEDLVHLCSGQSGSIWRATHLVGLACLHHHLGSRGPHSVRDLLIAAVSPARSKPYIFHTSTTATFITSSNIYYLFLYIATQDSLVKSAAKALDVSLYLQKPLLTSSYSPVHVKCAFCTPIAFGHVNQRPPVVAIHDYC